MRTPPTGLCIFCFMGQVTIFMVACTELGTWVFDKLQHDYCSWCYSEFITWWYIFFLTQIVSVLSFSTSCRPRLKDCLMQELGQRRGRPASHAQSWTCQMSTGPDAEAWRPQLPSGSLNSGPTDTNKCLRFCLSWLAPGLLIFTRTQHISSHNTLANLGKPLLCPSNPQKHDWGL